MSENLSNNKRIAKNTLLLYLRMFVIMATQLYTSRVVLSTLGVVDYGIYNVVGGVVAMFGFLNSAMATATQRFLTFELGKKNIDGQIKIFNTSIQIHLLLAIIIFVLAETVGLWFLNHKMVIPLDRIEAAQWVFHCSIISSLIVVMSVPFNASLIAHEKMSAFAYISIIEVFLKLLIVFVLMVLDIDKLKLYAVLLLFVQTIIILIYNSYCVRKFEEIQFRRIFDKGYFKKMITFSGWNILGVGANLCSGQGVNILLNMFFGPTVNAARAVTMQAMNAISQFSSNFMMAVNPQITKSYAVNNKEYLYDLIFKSSRVTFLLMSFLVIPLLFETPFILELWLKNVPEYTVHFFRLSLIIAIFDSLSLPLSQAIGATGNLKYYQITVGGLLLLILPVSYIFLKYGGSPLVVSIL